MGDRADKDSIGKFSDRTIIEAVFQVSEATKLQLQKMDIYPEEDKLIVTRTISKKSSGLRINGRIANLSTLREISSFLVDIYRQGDSNYFMNSQNYINLVDSYTKDSKTIKLKNELKDLYRKKDELLERHDNLDLSDEEITRERDLISYQINEIEEIDIFNIDEESLDKEYSKLNNISSIINSSNKVKEILDASDFDQISINKLINETIAELSPYTSVDEKLELIYTNLVDLSEQVNDLYRDIDYYESSLESDHERMYELDMINQTIFTLKRKYGSSIEDIRNYYAKITRRIKELDEIDDLRRDIDKKIEKINSKMLETSKKLTDIRKNKASLLEKEVNKSIKELNIKNGEFKIDITERNDIKANGKDGVDFLIRTNKGDNLKSLSKTASGGEVSRIMLAFKEVFSDSDSVDTLIFDEIDTGISGRTAQVVGEKILDLSKKRQIISISHLPQIASLANNHILIKKEDVKDLTISTTQDLSALSRVNEIARMIGGVDITSTTEQSAREMLEMAEDLRNDRR
ncbi:putative DNA repair protein RecN [Anaerococcus prevotii ACS-065-V-Col13]|uniref:DNA repair protein RecN n=1 Tax=Anaerococcus prevotii ACS-065-V-Col13 TaxID=879305 RepID=F0GUK4_9FIRM|nr:putative DNA repair protein RecN [Anaerococcus prevotii ACS-065-V-Col13]